MLCFIILGLDGPRILGLFDDGGRWEDPWFVFLGLLGCLDFLCLVKAVQQCRGSAGYLEQDMFVVFGRDVGEALFSSNYVHSPAALEGG